MMTGSKEKVVKLNIWQILEEMLAKWKLILLSAILCGLAVFLLTNFAMPHYYESAAYFMLESPVYKAGRMPTTEERHAFEAHVERCAQLLRTDAAVEALMAYTDPETDPEALMEMLYLEPVLVEAQIRVAVRGEDAKEVGRLAEKIGRLLPQLTADDPVYRKAVDEIPEKPVTPKVARDTAGAVIFGFMFGASLVVAGMLFPKVSGKSSPLPKQWNVPTLGAVPQADSKELELAKKRRRAATAPVGEAREKAYEAIARKILELLRERRASTVIGITGVLPGEGKSVTAVHLARVLARMGRKVLLVDGNLRRASIHEKVSLMARPGLTEVLSGKLPLDEAVRMVNASDRPFHVLRAGQLPGNPAKVLTDQKLQNLMQQLRRSYECILLDLPAVKDGSDVTDAVMLMDTCLMVIRESTCNTKQMAKALEKLEAAGGNVMGVVLSDITE